MAVKGGIGFADANLLLKYPTTPPAATTLLLSKNFLEGSQAKHPVFDGPRLFVAELSASITMSAVGAAFNSSSDVFL